MNLARQFLCGLVLKQKISCIGMALFKGFGNVEPCKLFKTVSSWHYAGGSKLGFCFSGSFQRSCGRDLFFEQKKVDWYFFCQNYHGLNSHSAFARQNGRIPRNTVANSASHCQVCFKIIDRMFFLGPPSFALADLPQAIRPARTEEETLTKFKKPFQGA